MIWQGGHPAGYIFKKGNRFSVVFQTEVFTERISVHIIGSEQEALERAEELRKRLSDEHNLTKNHWREIDTETIEMQLTQGKTVFFDKHRLGAMSGYYWSATPKGVGVWYAQASIPTGGKSRKCVRMHRLFHPEWKAVDHIDGNGLNNRDSNLRDGSGGVNDLNKRLRSNNISGENGISVRDNHLYLRWPKDGKLKSKSFNFRKYGDQEGAMKAAIEYRDTVIYPAIGCTNGKRPKII